MKKRVMDRLLMVGSIAAIASGVGVILYAVGNDSGHSAFSPYLGLWLFVPVTLAGMARLVFFRKPTKPWWPALLSLLSGALGIALLLYLDMTNTLLQYEVWMARGMP